MYHIQELQVFKYTYGLTFKSYAFLSDSTEISGGGPMRAGMAIVRIPRAPSPPQDRELLLPEPQADQIVLSPTGLPLDHGFQGFDGERIPSCMRRHSHTPAVRVAVTLMRSDLADEIKAIAREGGNQFSRSLATEGRCSR